MTPLQQLTQKIYTALPDLKELGVGCVFIRNTEQWRVIGGFTENNGSGRNRFIIETVDKENYTTSGFINTSFFAKQITIIGKPITITDVLRWLTKSKITVRWGYLLNLWDLKQNLLENQSIELVEFLNNL